MQLICAFKYFRKCNKQNCTAHKVGKTYIILATEMKFKIQFSIAILSLFNFLHDFFFFGGGGGGELSQNMYTK